MQKRIGTKKQRIASDYSKTAVTYNKRYEKIQFEKFKILGDLDIKGIVLDLGGGTGLLGKYLKKELVNVDSCFSMLKYSANLNVCADIDCLPFKSSCVDAVLSFTTLQNLPDFSTVFKEVRRVLKEGQFVCSVLNKVDVKELAREAKLAGFKIKKKTVCGEDIQFILVS